MQSKRAEVRIGIDLMGSENSPQELLHKIQAFAKELPEHVTLIAIGTPLLMAESKIAFTVASEVIAMDESPVLSVRRKKDASLCVGMRMLKEKKIDAFVSAGNTGAFVFSAKTNLTMIPKILRPALLALLPTKENPVAVLDVGANVQYRAIHLVQFALMGAAYQRARNVALPNVGLLNIGAEPIKGTSELRTTYQELQSISELQDPPFRFLGNVEGRSVFNGHVDVLITDGFTGNVFLKTAEGLASFVLDRLHTELPRDIVKELGPLLDDLQRRLHYAEYPGALLCGVNGIVIKCHGDSTPQAFCSAIREAFRIVDEGFLQRIQNKILSYTIAKK